jgi:phosphinothricin acetyltransferase
MTHYHLRLAQRRDLAAIVAIYNSTTASRQVTADLDPVTEAQRQPWFEQHQAAHRPLYVVTQAEQVIGWFSLSDFYGRPAYRGLAEVSLYLAPQVRGQGLGRRLIADIETIAEQCGVRDLLAIIFSHNHASMKLFSTAGYQTWGELPEVARMDDQDYSVTLLGKRFPIKA